MAPALINVQKLFFNLLRAKCKFHWLQNTQNFPLQQAWLVFFSASSRYTVSPGPTFALLFTAELLPGHHVWPYIEKCCAFLFLFLSCLSYCFSQFLLRSVDRPLQQTSRWWRGLHLPSENRRTSQIQNTAQLLSISFPLMYTSALLN